MPYFAISVDQLRAGDTLSLPGAEHKVAKVYMPDEREGTRCVELENDETVYLSLRTPIIIRQG